MKELKNLWCLEWSHITLKFRVGKLETAIKKNFNNYFSDDRPGFPQTTWQTIGIFKSKQEAINLMGHIS